MTIIRIDRSTIRKNPNAGNTVTYLPGTKELTGEYIGTIPDHYLHRLIVTSTDNEKQCFIANGDYSDILPLLREDKRASITLTNEPIRCDHQPEPPYTYAYEATTVECGACHRHIIHSSIMNEWSDDGAHYYVCPVCNEINTFDLRYERIQEALDSI
jgi:hypothetical protein